MSLLLCAALRAYCPSFATWSAMKNSFRALRRSPRRCAAARQLSCGGPPRPVTREFDAPVHFGRRSPPSCGDQSGGGKGLDVPEWPVDCHVGSLGGTNLQNRCALVRPCPRPRWSWRSGRALVRVRCSDSCVHPTPQPPASPQRGNSQRRLKPAAQLTACSASPAAPCSQQRSIL